MRAPAAALLTVLALPALAGEPAYSDDPGADVHDAMAEACPDGIGEYFVQERDWNGDGLEDVKIDWGEGCDEARMLWCGSFGCVTELWYARPSGGFVLGMRGQVTHLIPDEFEDQPAVRIMMDGQVCNRFGYESCISLSVWDAQAEQLRTVWKDY